MYQRDTVIQFTNLDIEKNLQCIFTSNKMLVIHKWSMKYTNKYGIIKHVLKVSNDIYPQFYLLKITLLIGYVTQL